MSWWVGGQHGQDSYVLHGIYIAAISTHWRRCLSLTHTHTCIHAGTHACTHTHILAPRGRHLLLRHSRRSTRASASSRHRGVLSLPQTSSRALPRGLCSRSRGRTVHDGGHGRRQAAGGWRAASGARGRGCGDGGGRWSCQSRRDAGAGGANQWRRPRGACRPQLRRRAAIGRRQRWEVLLRVGRRLWRRRCPWCVDAGASGGSWGGHTGGGCGCGGGGYGTLAATKGRPWRSCGNTGT